VKRGGDITVHTAEGQPELAVEMCSDDLDENAEAVDDIDNCDFDGSQGWGDDGAGQESQILDFSIPY
jgi:hypothetical protein